MAEVVPEQLVFSTVSYLIILTRAEHLPSATRDTASHHRQPRTAHPRGLAATRTRSQIEREIGVAAVHADVLLQPLELHQRQLSLACDIVRVGELGVLAELCAGHQAHTTHGHGEARREA